jgi:hypothetical protein
MARTVQEVKSPEAPPQEPPRTTSHRFRRVLGWAGVVVAVVAAAALAVITLIPASYKKPIAHPGLAEHGSIRAIEGSVEDFGDRSPVAGAHSGLAEHGSITALEGSAPDNRSTAEPCEVLERAVNPNGPGALVSEQAVHWVTDEDRSVVNPNAPGAPASEHSVDGAC